MTSSSEQSDEKDTRRVVDTAARAVAGLDVTRIELEQRVTAAQKLADDAEDTLQSFLTQQAQAIQAVGDAREALGDSPPRLKEAVGKATTARTACQAMKLLPVPEVDELANVRAVAKEWLGASTALVGLFSISGIVFAGDTVKELPPLWKAGFVICAILAVGVGALSIGFGTKAANGWPHSERKGPFVRKRQARDLHGESVDKKVAEAISDLQFAVGAAGVALLILLVSVVILWYGGA